MISRAGSLVILAFLKGALSLAAPACNGDSGGDNQAAPAAADDDAALPYPEYPLDDLLRVNHIQMKGTHNSYHLLANDDPIDELDYIRDPLDVQLADQGIRQFELDIHYRSEEQRFAVYHVPVVDEETTCWWFTDCLQVILDWSDANPGHHPIIIMVEPKDDVPTADEESIEGHYDEFDADILSVWPRERIITPDDVQDDYPSLGEAVRERGWPTLGEARDSIIVWILDNGVHRTNYSDGGATLAGRVAFVNDSANGSLAALKQVDNPIGNEQEIIDAVSSGLLVRTRADAVGDDLAGFPARVSATIDSGATAVTTDYPVPYNSDGYQLELPDGNPSRCNPITAPPECTNAAVENLFANQ